MVTPFPVLKPITLLPEGLLMPGVQSVLLRVQKFPIPPAKEEVTARALEEKVMPNLLSYLSPIGCRSLKVSKNSRSPELAQAGKEEASSDRSRTQPASVDRFILISFKLKMG